MSGLIPNAGAAMLGYVLVAVLAMAFGWSVRGGMERGLSRSRSFGDPATWN